MSVPNALQPGHFPNQRPDEYPHSMHANCTAGFATPPAYGRTRTPLSRLTQGFLDEHERPAKARHRDLAVATCPSRNDAPDPGEEAQLLLRLKEKRPPPQGGRFFRGELSGGLVGGSAAGPPPHRGPSGVPSVQHSGRVSTLDSSPFRWFSSPLHRSGGSGRGKSVPP